MNLNFYLFIILFVHEKKKKKHDKGFCGIWEFNKWLVFWSMSVGCDILIKFGGSFELNRKIIFTFLPFQKKKKKDPYLTLEVK